MTDDYANWRLALAGEKPAMHVDDPWCGYFKMRDRRGLALKNLPAKRPFIACAIWRDENGVLMAERAKSPVPVEWVWPYCARYPISHEAYVYWHQNESWPEPEEQVA